MSPASPTWKRLVAEACQFGTGGFGRSGQPTSSIPHGLPRIRAGKASPGLASSWRSGPTPATDTEVRRSSPTLPVGVPPVNRERSPKIPSAAAALKMLFSSGAKNCLRATDTAPGESSVSPPRRPATASASASPVASACG
jgi:hypothetical protein